MAMALTDRVAGDDSSFKLVVAVVGIDQSAKEVQTGG